MADCNALCAASSPCNGLYQEMIADVSPGGQYCTYTLSGSDYIPGDVASVLNSDYKNPTNYVNSSGILDSVLINGVKYPPQKLTLTQFIQNWKPSWASSLVTYHPEYCFYTRCVNDSASNRYDNDIENTPDFATACSKGYLDPLGYDQTGYSGACSKTNRDPYFKTGGYGANTTDTNWIKNRLDNYLIISPPGSGSIPLSLWATVSIMSICSADTLGGSGMSSCYSASDTTIGTGCAGNNNMEWLFFRGIYLSLKQHMQDSLDSVYVIGAGCAYANCIGMNVGACSGSVYSGKAPRHISLEYISKQNTSPSSKTRATEKSYVDSAMKANCDSVCLSYAYNWYHRLDSCGSILHTDSARLVAGLVAVCRKGCNASHPDGASTTPHSELSDSGDISFEDVIHRVLGKSYSDVSCNATLIPMPPPYYDSTGITGPSLSYYKPTPCQCGNIDTAYNIYHSDSLTGETLYKNFGDFLTKYYGDSISEVNAWSIKELCTGTCFYANSPVQMPLWMSCCQDSMKLQQVTGAGGVWTQKASIHKAGGANIPLSDMASFSIRDSGYVVGGDSSAYTAYNLWIWNQSTNTWTTGAPMPKARKGGIGFSINGKGYTGLGATTYGSTPILRDLLMYNPATNSWSVKDSLPDTARNNAFSFVIGDTAYIGCGDNSGLFDNLGNYFNSVWKYDPNSNTWTKRASFPGGHRTGLVAFSIGNYGYAGCGGDGSGHLHNDMWRFNPSTNTWTSIAPLPLPSGVFGGVAFVAGGKGYVGMGYIGGPMCCSAADSTSYTNKFWAYDPTSNTWVTVNHFSGSRGALGIGFSIGNLGYSGAGTYKLNEISATVGLSDFAQLSATDTVLFAAPSCCITCANIDTATNHFTKAYPTLKDTDASYPNLYTNYLNQYFGFNLTFTEYVQFQIGCDSARTNTIHLHNGTNLPLTLCTQSLGQPQLVVDTNSCYTQLMTEAQYNATASYNTYIDSVQSAFQTNYISHCMQVGDSFKMLEPYDDYHFTLYYYDQAGNLVKTVPPQGVHPITSSTSLNNIIAYRHNGTGSPTYPVDSLQTRYFYNTLNEPVKQQTPDGDSVHFWYDRLGRIVLSQNALQRSLLYSYTQYDALGRVIEVGQLSTVPANLPSCFHCISCIISYGVLPVLPDTFTRNDAELQNFINQSTRTQVIHAYYDSITYSKIPLAQQNLRKEIASITYEEKNDYNIKTYDNAIHYSYDIEGNVATIIIDVPHDSIVHQRYKRVNYYYDLVSGNVDQMIYEQDSIDQFIHNYDYDADNRLLTVNTSQDSLYWEEDADYQYYDHGPIAREIIGRRQVQGIDYAYTINGWLKGVNSSVTNPSYDMGHDGDVHDANNTIARDAYGFTLNYFTGDYRSIANTNFQAGGLPTTSLYNGNIAGATYSIQPLSPTTIGYTYQYDQLNRMVKEMAFKGISGSTWAASDSINDFKERVSYDENGNILMYLRHGNSAVGPTQMDSLTYHYTKGRNQLVQVNDIVPSTNYAIDIHNETSGRNYQYNGIGELARDSAGGLDTIIWNIYGKVKEIKKHNGDSIIVFYDPIGNRLEKRYYPHNSVADTTKYVAEVGGNILAVYDRKKDTVRLTEWDMYGNKRLGVIDTILRMQKPITGIGTLDSMTTAYLEGQKQYELISHLRNVLVTVSDKKIPVDTVSTDTLAKYYLPLVISAQDYYPFGMEQPGRTYLLTGDSTYNFGLNGMEKTNEIYGAGNEYTTEFRQYDPRLGRWMSSDPIIQPWLSPYSAFNNDPIEYEDPLGLYATKKEARQARRAAKKAGLDPSKIYKTGKSYGFNTVEDGAIVGNFKATSFGNTNESKGSNNTASTPPILNFNFNFNTHPNPPSIFEKVQNTIGTVSTFAGVLDKDFVGNAAIGISHSNILDVRFYSNFGGNQYFSAIKVARAGEIIGHVSLWGSTFVDGIGVWNFYNNPNASFVVSPAKGATNLGVGLYGLAAGPPGWVMSTGYFIFMALPPEQQRAVIEGEIEIMRERNSLIRQGIIAPNDFKY
ncbi:MAG TPA: kelch repeat-containing protein [Bacteroidia bacterium]|nr:kelch repeat-containing protein [Bacteroidia bacterium]